MPNTKIKKRKYGIPSFLEGVISQEKYERWLRRKAAAHLRRDRKYGNRVISGVIYRVAIHEAVKESNGKDAYTGERLDWKSLSEYSNIESAKGRRKYRARFALLPTVDHVDDRLASPNFRICSWRTNDAKGDMTLSDFLKLCRMVIAHHGKNHPVPRKVRVAAPQEGG
ncbi:MAG: hypothetical protein Q7S96_04105 [bacterium]|nr:hypothetical protein [bacterium]